MADPYSYLSIKTLPYKQFNNILYHELRNTENECAYADFYFDLSHYADFLEYFALLPCLFELRFNGQVERYSCYFDIFAESSIKLIIRTRFFERNAENVFRCIRGLFEELAEGRLESLHDAAKSLKIEHINSNPLKYALISDLSRISTKHLFLCKTLGKSLGKSLDFFTKLSDNTIEFSDVQLNNEHVVICLSGSERVYNFALDFVSTFSVCFLKNKLHRFYMVYDLDFTSCNFALASFSFKKDFKYDGAMCVITELFNREFLYKEVRLAGGAYDSVLHISPNGYGFLYSEKDPDCLRTKSVFKRSAEFLNSFSGDVSELLPKTLNNFCKPKHITEEMRLLAKRFFTSVSNERLLELENEIKLTTNDRCKAFVGIFDGIE